MRLVVKYGGSSVSTPGRVREAAAQVVAAARGGEAVAVCSAMGGTTDELLAAADAAGGGRGREAAAAASRVAARHRRAAARAVSGAAARRRLLAGLDADLSAMSAAARGMALLGEATPRSRDLLLSFGERLAARVLSAAVAEAGRRSVPLSGAEAGIVTDSAFGSARPLMSTTALRVSRALGPLLARGAVPVVGGFAGADQHGRPTTLGRGGSDYTATILGACVRADEVWLMSDVDGLMTADPRLVRGARVLPEVSYAEAAEMALFGAKQIHPRTFEPLLSRRVPLRVRSSARPGGPGTLVGPAPAGAAARTVKCVSAVRHSALVDMRGGSMVGAPGTAAEIFGALAAAGVNVMMISQNPSESSISIVVKAADAHRAEHAIESGPLGGAVRRVEVTPGVSVVALIGSGMLGTVGVASRVFDAVARRGVNVVMITQGSSELNLAFVVRDADAQKAVQALHDEFGLGG